MRGPGSRHADDESGKANAELDLGCAVPPRTFHVVIEQDEDGFFVGSVTELPGCHTQARTRKALTARLREAIAVYLEADLSTAAPTRFVGVEKVEV